MVNGVESGTFTPNKSPLPTRFFALAEGQKRLQARLRK